MRPPRPWWACCPAIRPVSTTAATPLARTTREGGQGAARTLRRAARKCRTAPVEDAAAQPGRDVAQAAGRGDVVGPRSRGWAEGYGARRGDVLEQPGGGGAAGLYAQARPQGRPVGSGVVEATCKRLFNVRLKRGGARWREARAGRLIRLRALAPSGRWEPAIALLLSKVAVEVRRAARAGWPADPVGS